MANLTALGTQKSVSPIGKPLNGGLEYAFFPILQFIPSAPSDPKIYPSAALRQTCNKFGRCVMDDAFNEDEFNMALHRMRQLLEVQRQGQPPPPSMWESWLGKASPGILHAILVDMIWPERFWWTILRFCLFLITKATYNVYFADGSIANATHHRVGDILLVISGYAAAHLSHKILYFLFVSGQYLLGFIWANPLVVCTVCAVLSGLISLMRAQSSRVTNIGWVLVHQVLSLGSGMIIIHFRFSVFCRKLWTSIRRSRGIQTCKLCLRYAILRLFGRPTFDELETFEYPLLISEQRQIRLLHLARQNPIFDIQAKLECYSLDAAPAYEAISYVWGEKTQKERRIILDGRKFFVSANVYQILCRRGSLFSSRFIWIDSICINQGDNVEKSKQVRMMKDIYHRASHVSICLGENPDAWLAWGMIKQLILYKAFMTREGLTNQLFHMIKAKDTNEWISAQLTAFIDLIDHPWFNRVWVVQEVVVARSASLLYGNEQLPWHQFIQVMDILFNPPITGLGFLLQHTGEGAVTRPVPFGPIQAAFMYGYRVMLERKQTFPLYYTLRLLQAFKSSEPRDKIFALLGLTESATELNHIIDYDKPLSRALVEVADDILNKGHLLEVLQLAGIGWDNVRTDIPSWVVDWSISREPVTLAHSFADGHLQYRAAVQRASEISYGGVTRHIRVRGQFIDRVQEMGLIMGGPDLNERNRPLETVSELIAWFDETEDLVNKNVANPYHNGQDLPEAIWRTVMGDRTTEARPAPDACEANIEKCRQLLHSMKDLAAKCGTDLSGIKELPSEHNPLLSQFPNWDGVKDWMADISEFTWLCGVPSFPRKLAITSKGYIGMVPKGTNHGDTICAIWGAQVPFVLRPNGGISDGGDQEYQLVGECYVHGMMDGECFNLPQKDETFEIV